MEITLIRLLGIGNGMNSIACATVPMVFIGGKLVGSMDRVLAFHISGTLVPLLKQVDIAMVLHLKYRSTMETKVADLNTQLKII
ncbi:Glutaredoxin-C3 [Glycine soja]